MRAQLVLPEGKLSIHLARNGPFTATFGGQANKALPGGRRQYVLNLPVDAPVTLWLVFAAFGLTGLGLWRRERWPIGWWRN